MRIATYPLNEDLRLQDLYAYDILDSESEKEFDDLLEMAADIYGCPMATITFIDQSRQWFKSRIGIGARETSRDISFCAHTILEQEILLVKDATKDERFSDNPLVTGELMVRFYAGVPIVSEAGYNLGTVCVVDNKPRDLSPEQTKGLTIIAQQISKLLELRLKNKTILERAQEQLKLEKLLLQKTLREHEQERFSISFELHENIAQGLAATKYFLELAELDKGTGQDMIGRAKKTIGSLINQVRDLSKAITPTTMEETNLRELLQVLVDRFRKQTGIKIRFVYEGETELNPEIALAVYRIVEDQLGNSRQHGQATEVFVHIQVFQSIYLSIKDDGKGIDLKHFRKGVGLNRVLSRVEQFSGSVDISGGPERGCELYVTIPLKQAVLEKEELPQ